LLHVPYKGAAPAMNDLLAGQGPDAVRQFFRTRLLRRFRAGKLAPAPLGGDEPRPAMRLAPRHSRPGPRPCRAYVAGRIGFGFAAARHDPGRAAGSNAWRPKLGDRACAAPEVAPRLREVGMEIRRRLPPTSFGAFISPTEGPGRVGSGWVEQIGRQGPTESPAPHDPMIRSTLTALGAALLPHRRRRGPRRIFPPGRSPFILPFRGRRDHRHGGALGDREGDPEGLGQSMVVENRPGRGAATSAPTFVAKAKPDGHTLLFVPPGPVSINQWL